MLSPHLKKLCVLCLVTQLCLTLGNPMDLLFPWGLSRQKHFTGLPRPLPGDLPNPRIEHRSPTLQEDSLLFKLCGKPKNGLAYPFSRGLPDPGSNQGLLHCTCILFRLSYWLVQFSSVTQSCPTLCDPMDCSMPGFPLHHQLLELTQTQVHPVGDAIQPSHPLLTSSLPAFIFPSIRVFSSESVLHVRWPKYWSFSINSF